jgi:phosphoribosylaminoimidazole-succinocarboxamide synthase
MTDGAKLRARGKVRDIYDVGGDQLLLVATDRISAFDVVLPNPIPDKGRVLSGLSLFWFDRTADLVGNHLLSASLGDFPEPFGSDGSLAGRAMLVRRAHVIPVECVARGYLTGSGLAEYQTSASVCGVNLPPGLRDGSRLPKTIFTPATKAALGDHDVNVTFDEVVASIGQDEAQTLRRLTVAVYERAAEIAADRGLILADTKLEFGLRADGRTVLGDEVLTPDSSRYWPVESWEPGRAQPSYDKQYVRDWLTSPASGWDRTSGEAPPPLPDDVVERTRAKYIEAYERLTGKRFS